MANGSVFEQALERSTPGFNSLLETIQTETSRIERNKTLVQERKMQEDLLRLQKRHEIDIYNATTGKQQELNRQLEQNLAEAEERRLRTQAGVEALQDQQEELSAQAEEIQEDLLNRWDETYKTIKLDEGFNFIPRPQIDIIEQGGGLSGVYTLQNGDVLTPDEYDERYGWVREAQQYIDRFHQLNTQDRVSTNSQSKELGTQEVTDVFGNPVTFGSEVVEESVVKQFLGKDQAISVIHKMRQGDQEVLRKFRQGLYDFNTVGEAEQEVTAPLKTAITNLQEHINQEVDFTPGAGVVGTGIAGAAAGAPFGGFGALIGLGVGVAAGIARPFFADKQPLRQSNIQQIDNYINQEYEESNPIRQYWSTIRNGLPRVEGFPTGTAWSELYINPAFNQDTPLSKFAVTKEEAENILQQMKPQQGNDFELTDQAIRERQSFNLFNQALRFNTDSVTQN